MITLSLCSLPLCLLLLPPHTFHFLPPPSSLHPPSILPLPGSEYKAAGTITSLSLVAVPSHNRAHTGELAKPSSPPCHRRRIREREGGPEISMYERSPLIASFDVNSLQTGSINLSLFFCCCSATERHRQRKVEMMFLQSHRGALNIS